MRSLLPILFRSLASAFWISFRLLREFLGHQDRELQDSRPPAANKWTSFSASPWDRLGVHSFWNRKWVKGCFCHYSYAIILEMFKKSDSKVIHINIRLQRNISHVDEGSWSHCICYTSLIVVCLKDTLSTTPFLLLLAQISPLPLTSGFLPSHTSHSSGFQCASLLLLLFQTLFQLAYRDSVTDTAASKMMH